MAGRLDVKRQQFWVGVARTLAAVPPRRGIGGLGCGHDDRRRCTR
jgi:hypothetical protein